MSRRVRLRDVVVALVSLAIGAVAVAGVVLYAGLYDISAVDQHKRPTYWVLETGLREAVKWRAPYDEAAAVGAAAKSKDIGFRCFQQHCVQCHGAPGVAPHPFAIGLMPVPSSLIQAGRDWKEAELFWITKYGLKMTGMPAWQFRFDDSTIWSIVAYLQVLPQLTPAEYRRLDETVAQPHCPERADSLRAADPERGKTAVLQFGCTACHVIDGVVGPPMYVGPPLQDLAQRKYIAGTLPNTRENMVRWLVAPQELRPATAMPDLGLTVADARDIAAFLLAER